MKMPTSYIKKTGIVVAFALVVGGITAFAQTFTDAAANPPSSTVSTLLNTGSSTQTMTGSLWAASIGANVYTFGTYLWDLENNLTTLHTQQLCIGGANGTCITSFPTVISHATITTGATTCNGGWCSPAAFTAAKVCVMNGYTHLVGSIQGGSGGNVCTWQDVSNTWSCDNSCTTSCSSRTLTAVYCDDNGTSRLQ